MNVGHPRSRMAFAAPLSAVEVEQIVLCIERSAFGASLQFEWNTVTSRTLRRSRHLQQVLRAVESDGLGLLDITPVDDPPAWQVFVSPSRGRSGTAPTVKWEWHSESEGLPVELDLESWLSQVWDLAVMLGPRIGLVTTAEETSKVFSAHRGAFHADRLDVLAGYDWVTIMDDELHDRLLRERKIDDFPWFERRRADVGGGRGVHWLRATREPNDLGPELVTRLRHTLEPLLPPRRQKWPTYLVKGWTPFAPEDLIEVPNELRPPSFRSDRK